MAKKLGVIVPYRNRYEHLLKFKYAILTVLVKQKIPHELIVVEQDDTDIFNRGKLLNIGFLEAEKLGCDYVVFHDVDMIPKEVDYSYADYPVHLATRSIAFEQYFGGITMFPTKQFRAINGFSNEYWGWGFEDDDLLFRCKLEGLKLDSIPIEDNGPTTGALKFNGNSAYVKLHNPIRTRGDFTIQISCTPGEIILDHEKREDKYTIFGIPGYDFNIMYTGFRRYAVEWFDGQKNHQFIYSRVKPQRATTLTVTYTSKEKTLKFYQDAKLVGEKQMENTLYLYTKEKNMYLGCSNPEREEDINYFSGNINSFATWRKVLPEEEIKELAFNHYFGLASNFEGYSSASELTSYYDAKFIKDYTLPDITGKAKPGKIVNCELVKYDCPNDRKVYIPYRRESDYKTMEHEDQGFLKTGWKDITTRYNQLRFMNEVRRGYRKPSDDGLNNCKYRVLTHSNVRNQTQLTVHL